MEIITKSEASAKGLTRYFTGKPCRRGHISERGVAGGHCCDCHNLIAKSGRARNTDRIKSFNQAYYKKNADTIKESQRAKRADNPDRERQLARARYAKNPSHYLELRRKYELRNPDHYRKKRRESYTRHADKIRERAKAYREKNPDWKLSANAKRRAIKKNAVPSWFSEIDSFVWTEATALRSIREKETGISWAVDHMIPLSAKEACGLHCASNCQVIPADLNNQKHNKMVLTQPGEWIRHLK